MNQKSDAGASSWIDPDDAPEMTDEDFARADVYHGGQLVRRGRGRPKAAETREQIALRVDRTLLERFRASGPGWQTRMHNAIALVDQFEGDIVRVQEQLAAIRDGRVSLNADDGTGWRNINAEGVERLEAGIADLRRAIEIALRQSPASAG